MNILTCFWKMISDWEQDIHQRKMNQWALEYPFAAQVMCGNMSQNELVDYWRSLNS